MNGVRRKRERKADALDHPVCGITRVDEAEPIEEGGSLIRLDEASRSGRRRIGGAGTRYGERCGRCSNRGRAESAVLERELSERRERTRAAARRAPHATFSVGSEDVVGVTACKAGDQRRQRAETEDGNEKRGIGKHTESTLLARAKSVRVRREGEGTVSRFGARLSSGG
jgi:hypothetical protein